MGIVGERHENENNSTSILVIYCNMICHESSSPNIHLLVRSMVKTKEARLTKLKVMRMVHARPRGVPESLI